MDQRLHIEGVRPKGEGSTGNKGKKKVIYLSEMGAANEQMGRKTGGCYQLNYLEDSWERFNFPIWIERKTSSKWTDFPLFS